jgi:hypothetical protein
MHLRNPRRRAVLLLCILVGITLAVPSSSTAAQPSMRAVSASSAANRMSAFFDPPPPAAIEPSALYEYGVTTVAISDTLLYYGEEKALNIVDVSDPSLPVVLSHTPLPRVVFDIEVVGHFVYAAISAETGQGLQIIDVSDPSQPVLHGLYPLTWAVSLQVVGNVAFVGTGVEGLFMIDVSDPDNPTLLSVCCDGSSIYAFRVVGNRAYIASYWLMVVDVSDSAAPIILSKETMGFFDFMALCIVGNRMYVTDGSIGLYIFDVSDPAHVVRIGKHEVQGGAFDVQIIGSYAYLASGIYGVRIFDISDPTAAELQYVYEVEGMAQGIVLDRGLAYIAGGDSGLQILDVADPAVPQVLSQTFLFGSKVYMPSVLR